jgi:hypothetical protein
MAWKTLQTKCFITSQPTVHYKRCQRLHIHIYIYILVSVYTILEVTIKIINLWITGSF